MITREEFLHLYERCQSGLCSDAEKDLLQAYSDELKLSDNVWEDDDLNEVEVYNRIWEKLHESRNTFPLKKNINYTWIKATAVIFLGSAAACFLLIPSRPSNVATQIKTQPAPAPITPGGNKALLVLANGSRIALNDAKNGKLTVESGTQITKARDGMLVYSAGQQNITGNTGTSAAAPADINVITTPRGGQYQLLLADGTKVWLNAASALKFPAKFSGKERRVELSGEAYFEVHKNPSVPFIVHTSGQDVKVLGTHFNIKAYSDEAAVKTSLLQGRVNISAGGETTSLLPGFEAISNQGRTKIREADVQQSIAWKNGQFKFNNATIEEVMLQLSRWYDADIVITNPPLPVRQFTGTISRQVPIDEILAMLRYTGVKFQIRERQILVER